MTGRRKEVEGLNPLVLRWARERSGRTVEEVAEKIKQEPSVVRDWERGSGAPTYAELERLAYGVLKRPVAVFFFPEPPAEASPEQSFRTLPGFELTLLPATRHAIRRARADQMALSELFEDTNPSPQPLLRRLRVDPHAPASRAAEAARVALGVPVEEQTTSWRRTEDALHRWREAFEGGGVFVFKDAIKQKGISGFCLYDHAFPLIVLNNSTSLTRQVFTLFHELGHLLLRTSGVTLADQRYLGGLEGESLDVEVFCNRFATEILVPGDDFARRTQSVRPDDEAVERLAYVYKVSREVVLRRFMDLGRVTKKHYEQKAQEWSQDYQRHAPGGEGGGDYYRTRATYLSPRLLREVLGRHVRGTLDAVEAAALLGVKPAHIAGLEEVALSKVGG